VRSSGLARWAALSGALFVTLWATAFLVLGDTVESGMDSGADILAGFGDEGQRARGVIALVLLVMASLPFIVFISVLRGRLKHGEGGAGVWTMAAFGAGLVSTALWIVTATLYAPHSWRWTGKAGITSTSTYTACSAEQASSPGPAPARSCRSWYLPRRSSGSGPVSSRGGFPGWVCRGLVAPRLLPRDPRHRPVRLVADGEHRPRLAERHPRSMSSLGKGLAEG
jgi:hypothetical protein